ncbi:MAG: hypothetical protein Q4E10_02045 [Porphyromonas sp.]|nr:hypothetical protein [Porphyromonas sp.]
MYKVGIVGSEGYVVGELYNLLIQHPDVHLEMIYAPHRAGMRVAEIFNDLNSMRELIFTDQLELEGLDVLFLCMQSAATKEFLGTFELPKGLKVIDFSQAFRHTNPEETGFIYGLPEAKRRTILSADRVSVPGAFASAIQTPLIPLAKHLLLNSDIHACSVAGKTEALARPHPTVGITYDMLFDNFHVIKPLEHHHIGEIASTLREMQNSFDSEIVLIPMRGDFTRGVYTAMYLDCPVSLESIKEMYESHFDDHSFVHIVDSYPDVRDTVNTNEMHIHLSKHGDRLLIVSTMDNLMKGAAGTAVHIMNLMLGLVETTGLNVKPSVF